MILRPRLRRRRHRLPDRIRPLALPDEACVVCGGPGAHAANGYYCNDCRPVYTHAGNLAPNSGASREDQHA